MEELRFLKNKEREKGVLRVLIFDVGVDELF
jgi:hypothetical protein